MSNITYVTGNYGKYISVKEHFEKEEIDVNFFEYDFNESEINDIEIISKEKVLEAYQILKKPCFVIDSGFYIDYYPNHPGYPGAFVKRSGISTNVDDLLEVMKEIKNRTCKFMDCLTFYDGFDFHVFWGISEGNLSYSKKGQYSKKAKSNLWYVFVPKNCEKTLAQMTDEERKNRNDGHTSATEEFVKWYKKEYKKEKILVKRNAWFC